jgi:hypothetical protein
MSNFSVPLVPDDPTTVSPKMASEQAFYAVGQSGDATPIDTYDKAQTDLVQTGKSDYVDQQNEQWRSEHDINYKESVANILTDPTYSPEIKKSLVRNYALTNPPETSLRDRYIQKTAIVDDAVTSDDRLAQDQIVEQLPLRKQNNTIETINDKTVQGQESFLVKLNNVERPYRQSLHQIGSNILYSIPAGLAGIYQLIAEQDSGEAEALMREIQSHAYAPKDEQAQKITESVMAVANKLQIPAKTIGDFMYKTTKFWTQSPTASAIVATAGQLVLDPLNYTPFLITKGFGKTSKLTPRIPTDSPLAATEVANPSIAAKVAVEAIKEPTGKLVAAIQADKGEIIHDWVLPKIMPTEVGKLHPDLVAEIIKTDEALRTTFQDLRYDPNIINATEREAEVGRIFQVLKESRTPHYQQSNSLINETNSIFEGKAVFGRNGNSGYLRESDVNAAYDNLKASIEQLPKEEQGALKIVKEDGQHYIHWNWKREYNDIQDKMFGIDSIQTSIAGIDASNLARSSLGRWIFSTGKLPQWLEFGATRGIERAARLRKELTDTVRLHISNTPHKKELDYLINDAEAKGIDYYSPTKLQGMFPQLSSKEITELFTAHTWWRRAQQYNHNFMNRKVRHDLVSGNMKGLYDKAGNYLGPATDLVSSGELQNIAHVWDMDKGVPVKFNKEQTDVLGQTLVRLHNKVEDGSNIYHYGLIGRGTKLDLLPQEVLARIPGYSGRKWDEPFYVDVIPTKLNINGYSTTDKQGLHTYKRTVAAARTEIEANKIKAELETDPKYKDHKVIVRADRQDSWGKVMTDYQVHQEFLKHSMKRGEKLPSANGIARLEDRKVTLINTINSLSRMDAFNAWDEAFQKTFTKSFANFTQGKFPSYTTDISLGKVAGSVSREVEREFKTAIRLFEYYKQMKNTQTFGDYATTELYNGLADIFEKFKLPTEFNSIGFRLRGQHQNPLMIAKTIATFAFIHMNPIRQWIIQPAQQLEMYMINPQTASKNFANMMAIRMYISAENTKAMEHFKDVIMPMAMKAGQFAGEKDFLETVNAIKKSGVLQAIDMNSIVHGIINEVDRNLIENLPQKVFKDIEAVGKAVPRAMRTVGFDAAELTNRVGNWLQTKDMWITKNPGKSWKSKEALEQISAHATNLSGAMNRAGQLPYQQGALSIAFQFAAINQKMLINLLQDNSTLLTGWQRARLAAARMALYGAYYGIPGGAAIYYFVDRSKDEEIKKNAEVLKRGLADYTTNKMLAALTGDKVDLTISKIATPYADAGIPYLQVGWETIKMINGDKTGMRYPALSLGSNFLKAAQDINGWFVTREVNPNTAGQMFMEATEVASGFNNYTKGLVMLGIKDNVTRNGNQYGMQYSATEAYAKMLTGIGTQKEEDLWNLVEISKDKNKQIHDMASTIHQQMLNQKAKLDNGVIDVEAYQKGIQRFNSFINLLDPTHFDEADKIALIDQIARLDKKSYETIKQSVFMDVWKHIADHNSEEFMRTMDILRRSNDPETKKFIKALDEGTL